MHGASLTWHRKHIGLPAQMMFDYANDAWSLAHMTWKTHRAPSSDDTITTTRLCEQNAWSFAHIAWKTHRAAGSEDVIIIIRLCY